MEADVTGSRGRAPGVRLLLELAALLFALPYLQGLNRDPVRSFNAEWSCALILCLLALCVPFAARGRGRLQWPLIAWLAAFLVIATGQLAAGWIRYPGTWLGLASYLFALFIAYAAGRSIVASGLQQRVILSIATALVFAGSVSVLLQWLQSFGVSILPDWMLVNLGPTGSARPSANVGQPNLLATLMAAAIAACLLLFRGARSPAWRFALCAWLAFGISWTGSRLGLVYVGLLAVAPFLPIGLRPERLRDRVLICLAILSGCALGYAIPPQSVQPSFVSLTSRAAALPEASPPLKTAGADAPAPASKAPPKLRGPALLSQSLAAVASRQDTIAIRLKLWKDALAIAAVHPWFGSGFGQYARVQFWEAAPGPFLVVTNNVHNAVLQVAAEMGWPLASALCAYGFWWLLAGWRERIRSPGLAFCMLVMAMIGMHSMLEWPLWLLHFAAPGALLLALAEPEAKAGLKWPPAAVAALGAAGLAASVWYGAQFNRIAAAYDAFQFNQGNTERALQAAADTPWLSPFKPHAQGLQYFLLDASGAYDAKTLSIAGHVLDWSYQPRLCARYLSGLIRSGRIDEATRLASRLALFSWEDVDTREAHDWVRTAIVEAGPGGAPVLAAFEASAASAAAPVGDAR